MKNFLLTSCLFIAGLAQAQDTLTIDNTIINANLQNDFILNDSITLSYDVSSSFDTGDDNVYQKANVYNQNGNFYEVEDQILPNQDTIPFINQGPSMLQAKMVLAPSVFANGNNTVVIWPEKVKNKPFVKDSVKFKLNIINANNSFYIDFEKSVRILNNHVSLTNIGQLNQFISIYNLKGQIILESEIKTNETKSLYIPKGLFILNIVEGDKSSSTKILVK